MTNLIEKLFDYTLEDCSVRDYKGYHQHREVLLTLRLTKWVSYRWKMPWRFLVTGLRDEEGNRKNTAQVIKFDGSLEEVLIDKKDRIIIAGKAYANWISYF